MLIIFTWTFNAAYCNTSLTKMSILHGLKFEPFSNICVVVLRKLFCRFEIFFCVLYIFRKLLISNGVVTICLTVTGLRYLMVYFWYIGVVKIVLGRLGDWIFGLRFTSVSVVPICTTFPLPVLMAWVMPEESAAKANFICFGWCTPRSKNCLLSM